MRGPAPGLNNMVYGFLLSNMNIQNKNVQLSISESFFHFEFLVVLNHCRSAFHKNIMYNKFFNHRNICWLYIQKRLIPNPFFVIKGIQFKTFMRNVANYFSQNFMKGWSFEQLFTEGTIKTSIWVVSLCFIATKCFIVWLLPPNIHSSNHL